MYGVIWVSLVSGKFILSKSNKEEPKVEKPTKKLMFKEEFTSDKKEVIIDIPKKYRRKIDDDNPDTWSHRRKRIYN